MYRVLIKGWRGDASSLGRDERVLERKQRVFEVSLEERNLMLKATYKAWESEKTPARAVGSKTRGNVGFSFWMEATEAGKSP